MRKAIVSDRAPRPRGPYSPAVVASGPTVYVSAQGPIDPTTDQALTGPFAEQAEQVFRNVGELLTAAGTDWAHAVKVTIYLADFADFAQMNEIYLRYVCAPYPARSTVQVAALPKDVKIEIEAIAVRP